MFEADVEAPREMDVAYLIGYDRTHLNPTYLERDRIVLELAQLQREATLLIGRDLDGAAVPKCGDRCGRDHGEQSIGPDRRIGGIGPDQIAQGHLVEIMLAAVPQPAGENHLGLQTIVVKSPRQ